MKYKRTELTRFAKECAYGVNQMLNGICIAEEISQSDIGRDLINDDEIELLFAISKRFAKYAKDQMDFDVENSDVQNFQNIIEKIVRCCEGNNWFIEQ